MHTPIADFISKYIDSDISRLHMPGHKGKGALGCEKWDITEIQGADALYEANGIIRQSCENASALFESATTLYSTEGSSQCIRAMMYLAITNMAHRGRPVVVAARNVHKAFIYAAALLDFDVVWLYPRQGVHSICSCPVTAEQVEKTLEGLNEPPAAVYLTSPDYLGGMADISSIAKVCHTHGTILAVDNAHGAYLKFLPRSLHPLDLGADICCDSAHKTLPVLTGGAYLHISRTAPERLARGALSAMALFGSTSPSYLTLASLDLCNKYLWEEYPEKLENFVEHLELLRSSLRNRGWEVEHTDPLRLTIPGPQGVSGTELAELLRKNRVECEYADGEYLVLMPSVNNTNRDLDRIADALGYNAAPPRDDKAPPVVIGQQVMSIRQAVLAPQEEMPIDRCLGRICASPLVSCPPAIPISVSGEVLTREVLDIYRRYGIEHALVVSDEPRI